VVRARKGFSLIELLMVLAVTAILASTVMVAFSAMIRPRLETTMRNLWLDLCYTRSLAVNNMTAYALVVNATTRNYRIYRSPTPSPADYIPANLVKQVLLDVDIVTSPIANLTAHPPGNTSGCSWFNLTFNNRTKRIQVYSDTGFFKMIW